MKIDSAAFRHTLGHFCSGIAVVTAVDAGLPVGFTCQSFVSLSLDPPLVGFAPALSSKTYPAIRRAKSFCVNVLADTQQDVSVAFARRDDSKWQGIRWRAGLNGNPLLDGALASIDCCIENEYQTGDHFLVVGRVLVMQANAGRPLLYYQGKYTALRTPH